MLLAQLKLTHRQAAQRPRDLHGRGCARRIVPLRGPLAANLNTELNEPYMFSTRMTYSLVGSVAEPQDEATIKILMC